MTDVLSRSSEMGVRMHALDWASTPIGSLEHWPQSLRTAVSICLDSRFPILIWWGPELVMLYNDAYRPMLGATKHPSALGQPGRECWPEIWHVIGPMLEGVLATGAATWSDDQLLLLDRNGYLEECYFTFSYSPIRDESGGVGGVFCAVTETTQRVLSERRLQTLRDLGDRNLAEARTITDACRAAAAALASNPHDLPFALIYLLDDNGHHARLAEAVHVPAGAQASPAVIRVGGMDDPWNVCSVVETQRSSVVDDLEAQVGRLPAGPWADDWSRRAVVAPIARSGVQDRPAGFLVAGLSPHLAFTDDYRSFIELAAGHLATAFANAHAYEAERARAEALAAIDRAKTAFFSNVSHEFRTPLTLLLGPLEDALSHPDRLPADVYESLDVAHRNALRLLKLVNTLLDFSRIEAGRIEASYVPTNLAAFTAELASVFRSTIERAGLYLTIDCPTLPAPVYVDPELWEKIVFNLLSNAYKFTFAGGITVGLHQEGGSVELIVRDTGTGIPAEELPHLFERFHRFKGARGRTFEGSGIGLALVQELVKLHGGTVRVESAVDHGTTFVVSVPLGTAHLPPDRISAGRTPASPSPQSDVYVEEMLQWLPDKDEGRGLTPEAAPAPTASSAFSLQPSAFSPHPSARILLADDNADMREYLRRLLGQVYNVVAVNDGAVALEAAREAPFDLVLSDVMMPELDGFDLLRALRADERTRDVPVILLSARAGEEARLAGVGAGADDYLVKPFSARELLARVTAHLRLHRLRRETIAALRESEARLQLALDAVHMGVWEWSPTTNAIWLDARSLALFGLDGDTFDGTTDALVAVIAEADLPVIRQHLGEALRQGTPYRAEFRVRHAGGSVHWLSSTAQPTHDAHGAITRFIGVSLDITERKQTEAALRASEDRLAFLLQLNDRLRPLTDPEAIQFEAACALGEYLHASRVGYAEDQGDGETIVVTRNYTDGAPGIEGRYRYDDYGPELLRAFRAGRTVVRPDIAADPTLTAEEKAAHALLQLGATVNVPLVKAGKLVAVLFMHYREARHWSADELALLEAVGARTWDAVERARAEAALRESEERYRTLLDSIDQGFCLFEMLYDPAGNPVDYRFLQVNRTFERHTGLRDAVGRTALDLVPDLEPHWITTYAQVAASGQALRFEQGSAAMDRWFEVEAVRVGEAERHQVALIFTDITARRQADADTHFLSEVSEQIRTIEDADQLLDIVTQLLGQHLEVTRCFFAEIDNQGERWTVRHEDRLLTTLPTLIGDHRPLAFPPLVLEMLRVGRSFRSDNTALDERTAQFFDTAYQPLGMRAVATIPLHHNGRWVANLVVSCDRPHAWTARELSLLETVAERTWNAVEKLRLTAAQHAYLTRLQQLNAASLRINAALTRDDLLRLTAEQARLLTGARQSITSTTTDRERGWLAVSLIGRDGRNLGVIQLSDKVEGEFTADDEALLVQLAQVAAIALENQQLYTQEQAARAQAEEASRIKDEFLATVSHELRTPLTAFLGYAQLLQRRPRDEAYVRHIVAKLVQSAKTQAALIEDLLDVSRIVSGKLRIEPEPIGLISVIHAALDTVRPTVEAKGLQVQVDLNPAASAVPGDANRLQQVIWNLLSNATKFTPPGGWVRVQLAPVGTNAELTVSDSGQGIRAEFLPYVFDRFRQADSSSQRAYGGLGLGLAIVRHLVELHGGTVEATSAGVGQGATFTVRLPLARAHLPVGEVPSATVDTDAPDEDSAPLGGLRVLVVDDQPAILDLIEEILTSYGAAVRGCLTAREGLALVHAWQPDVLVSDIAMPDEDGYWLIQQVRSLAPEEGGTIPAVALTAYVGMDDRLRVLAAGFQQYVPKPVDAAELRDVIARLVVGQVKR